jgi:hypothetical protein
MTDPGSGASPSGSRPGAPDGSWAPPEQGAQAGTTGAGWAAPQQGEPVGPSQKKNLKKWLPIAGSVAAVGIIGAGALGFGFGDPEVGDCVQMAGKTEFEVVDCGADAEYRIVGVEQKEQNYADFMADDTVCTGFATAEMALWIGDLETEPGTAYCAEAL